MDCPSYSFVAIKNETEPTKVLPMTDYSARRTMMVDTQVRPSDVTKFHIIDAMLAVPRENFVPRDRREAAYVGENVDLGGGRVVLEPRTLAKILDALDVRNTEFALDIGSGFGYSSAVLSRMAEAVVALEENEEWSNDAQEALSEFGADNVICQLGTLCDGAPQHAPYDVILLQGAVEHLPQAIVDQLKEGGRIACLFAEGALGTVKIGYKLDGKMNWRYSFNAGAPVIPGFERHHAFTL
jgi:protein-L-isoaspartate(D-aspartate) O-methyltransferase